MLVNIQNRDKNGEVWFEDWLQSFKQPQFKEIGAENSER